MWDWTGIGADPSQTWSNNWGNTGNLEKPCAEPRQTDGRLGGSQTKQAHKEARPGGHNRVQSCRNRATFKQKLGSTVTRVPPPSGKVWFPFSVFRWSFETPSLVLRSCPFVVGSLLQFEVLLGSPIPPMALSNTRATPRH